MMEKDQIEEMAIGLEEEFALCGTLSSCGTKRCSRCFSKYLYEQGYRKLPEDSVVLTKEEYEMLINQYKNLEIKYSNLSDNYRLCKDANEVLKYNVVTTRKETAKEILNRINEYNLDYNWDLKVEFIKLCEDYGVEVEDD